MEKRRKKDCHDRRIVGISGAGCGFDKNSDQLSDVFFTT